MVVALLLNFKSATYVYSLIEQRLSSSFNCGFLVSLPQLPLRFKRSLDLDDVSFLHRVAINMAIALNLASPPDETSDAKKAVKGENFYFHSDVNFVDFS